MKIILIISNMVSLSCPTSVLLRRNVFLLVSLTCLLAHHHCIERFLFSDAEEKISVQYFSDRHLHTVFSGQFERCLCCVDTFNDHAHCLLGLIHAFTFGEHDAATIIS